MQWKKNSFHVGNLIKGKGMKLSLTQQTPTTGHLTRHVWARETKPLSNIEVQVFDQPTPLHWLVLRVWPVDNEDKRLTMIEGKR